jgi:Ca-activated chloride channel family protein
MMTFLNPQIEEKEELVPLIKSSIDLKIEGAMGAMNLMMTFLNPLDNPLECEYEFPFEKDVVLTSLRAKIGDREIETVVEGKEKAQEKYDDSVAKGNAAVLANRKQAADQEYLTVKIGNLNPKQTC